jgi:hypothetical protein
MSPYPRRVRKPVGEWWKSTTAQKKPRALLATLSEPSSYHEAIQSDNADDWRQTMDEEMASLHANNTWTLEALPPGVKSIPTMWIYKQTSTRE